MIEDRKRRVVNGHTFGYEDCARCKGLGVVVAEAVGGEAPFCDCVGGPPPGEHTAGVTAVWIGFVGMADDDVVLQLHVDGQEGRCFVSREMWEAIAEKAGWDARARAAEPLWQLLDDIDTLSDITKGDHVAFYTLAMRAAERRHKYAESPDGQTLEWSRP
jgi:hypothetical protein